MHLAIKPDILEDLAAVGLEGAAVIVQRHPQQGRDQPVGDDRGQPAGQRIVLARHALIMTAASAVLTLIEASATRSISPLISETLRFYDDRESRAPDFGNRDCRGCPRW